MNKIAWNDPDMLEVGVGWSKNEDKKNIRQGEGASSRLTEEEATSHFSLWCMLAGSRKRIFLFVNYFLPIKLRNWK